MFWSVWYNHSFANAVAYWWPAGRSFGRIVLSLFGALTSTFLLWHSREALRKESQAEAAFWLVAFATAALATVVGYSNLSISYNLITVFPGALVLSLAQRQPSDGRERSWLPSTHSALLLIATLLLFCCRIGGRAPGSPNGFPASAFGLVLIVLWLAWTTVRLASPGRHSTDGPGENGSRNEARSGRRRC